MEGKMTGVDFSWLKQSIKYTDDMTFNKMEYTLINEVNNTPVLSL